MLRALFHRLTVALTLLAFVGGMTLQLMPPKAALASGSALAGDCAHMATPADHAGPVHKGSCKTGVDYSECIKQMGCLGTPSLPLRLDAASVPIAYTTIAYWTPARSRQGRSIKPDLFPPIAL